MGDFEIHPGNRRRRTLSYAKADGSPGQVESPPEWSKSDDVMADIEVDADGMIGFVAHNGSVGDVIVSSEADGDLGLGVNRIVIADTFHMLPPLGAVGGSSSVGEEERIPA